MQLRALLSRRFRPSPFRDRLVRDCAPSHSVPEQLPATADLGIMASFPATCASSRRPETRMQGIFISQPLHLKTKSPDPPSTNPECSSQRQLRGKSPERGAKCEPGWRWTASPATAKRTYGADATRPPSCGSWFLRQHIARAPRVGYPPTYGAGACSLRMRRKNASTTSPNLLGSLYARAINIAP
jgi:hypothetical protein